jgi:hypothetical protein
LIANVTAGAPGGGASLNGRSIMMAAAAMLAARAAPTPTPSQNPVLLGVKRALADTAARIAP